MAVSLLPPASEFFVVIAKKAYVPLYNDSDQSPISCLHAIRYGLDALLKADASDYEREDQLWSLAFKALTTEEDNLVGAGAQGSVQMDDSFGMECFPVGL